ncbi:protein translocase subunit SecF [bacterium]|nr:MAG: protein translocase subunit SecF [bacterium]
MRLFETANYSFIENKKIGYIISSALIAISILGIVFKGGLQYGIDFKGGKEFVLEFAKDVSVNDVRSALTDVFGSQPEVKNFGGNNIVLVRTDSEKDVNSLKAEIASSLKSAIPDNASSIQKTDNVTARFSEDLKLSAIEAIIYSIVMIFLYILLRFRNWRFSAGAVAALIHDVTITLGLFTILNDMLPFSLTIDQTIIAAFLTIVGYSLNDTVVVFDRIRENAMVHKGMEYSKMINMSINNTLSRTVITSGTTLFVVVVLFIFGGEVLKGFSFALLMGILIGTYSSIFIASSLVVDLDKKSNTAKS